MNKEKDAVNDFTAAKDNSKWHFTNIIQTGKNSWQKLDEKFWRVPETIQQKRYAICKECDRYIAATTQCTECYCAMGLKTWLGSYSCPLDKWQVEVQPKETTKE